MTPWALVSLLLSIIAPADWTAPPVRGKVVLPSPPAPPPSDTLALLDVWHNGCTYSRIGTTTVTATHCLTNRTGWSIDGERAWRYGPEPEWADPALIPRGATIWAIGYPLVGTVKPRTTFALAALQPQVVYTHPQPTTVLMTLGTGQPCTPGASGMVGWVSIEGVPMPVGPLSVYSINPAVTGLPVGQYVCGFAI